jgi:hypothetical protein
MEFKPFFTIMGFVSLVALHIPLAFVFALFHDFQVWTWAFITLDCSPYFTVFAAKEFRKEKKKFEGISTPPRSWEIETTLEKYIALIEKQHSANPPGL